VLATSYLEPTVVMFSTSWCAPCKIMKPLLERLSVELYFQLVMVNADATDSRSLLSSESVRSVPTIIVYSNGKQVGEQLVGNKTAFQVAKFLQENGVIGSQACSK